MEGSNQQQQTSNSTANARPLDSQSSQQSHATTRDTNASQSNSAAGSAQTGNSQEASQQTQAQQTSRPAINAENTFFEAHSRIGQYRLSRFLGSGATASVRLANRYPNTQNEYVVKVYTPRVSERGVGIQNEINAMVYLQQRGGHKNITSLVEVFFRQPYYSATRRQVIENTSAIVLEYCARGCLFDYVKEVKFIEPHIVRKMFRQAAKALQFIHQNGYVHRDIKLENIMLTHEYVLKLADLGYASPELLYPDGLHRSYLGTKSYMAPELYMKRRYNAKSVDIFALGTALFTMHFGYPPFKLAKADSDPFYSMLVHNPDQFWQLNRQYVSSKLQRRVSPHHNVQLQARVVENVDDIVTPQFKDLINRMLNLDPARRPTIQEVLQHEWLQGPRAHQAQVAEFLSAVDQAVEQERWEELQRDPPTGNGANASFGPKTRSDRPLPHADDNEVRAIKAHYKLDAGRDIATAGDRRVYGLLSAFAVRAANRTPQDVLAHVIYGLQERRLAQFADADNDLFKRVTFEVADVDAKAYRVEAVAFFDADDASSSDSQNTPKSRQKISNFTVEVLQSSDKSKYIVHAAHIDGDVSEFRELLHMIIPGLNTLLKTE